MAAVTLTKRQAEAQLGREGADVAEAATQSKERSNQRLYPWRVQINGKGQAVRNGLKWESWTRSHGRRRVGAANRDSTVSRKSQNVKAWRWSNRQKMPSRQVQLFSSPRQACDDVKKNKMGRPRQARKRTMARGRRDRAIPEVVRNSLTEKFQLAEFGAGLTASKDTATRMPANAEKSVQNLLHFCGGSLCETKCCTNRSHCRTT